jgi:AcrR family transcriptional regulator
VAAREEIDPRVERSRDHVLTATIDLLREVGYGGLTIEAVAARSGVAKSTIYRHWAGKPQLVADAFAHAHGLPASPPPGPVRDRVVAVLRDLLSSMVGTPGSMQLACMLPALIDAAERSDQIAELSARLADANSAPLKAVLDEAVGSGELPAGTDTRVLVDALVGPILLCRLFHRPCVGADGVPDMVDQILPAARPAPATPA